MLWAGLSYLADAVSRNDVFIVLQTYSAVYVRCRTGVESATCGYAQSAVAHRHAVELGESWRFRWIAIDRRHLAALSTAAPTPVVQRVTLDADTLFDFDKSVLRPAGKAALDDFIAKLDGIKPEVINATGHTDRFGSEPYNQRLSERRVLAVGIDLVGKGVESSRIHTEGKGETQPVTKAGECQGARSKKVIACLQPESSGANVPGAIAGAIIGGILGHQIGGGRGQDLATAGGAVAGAAVGANVGRDGDGREGYSRNVQRCSGSPNRSRPEYWDVTYEFQGLEHRVQMRAPPGPTVTVNGQGEPRE